jgi:hypothetical protein
MNKEIRNFVARAKDRMVSWSAHIDDPHAEVYARAFSNIIDDCVDADEYEQKKRRMIEIADKLSSMGYRILRVSEQQIDVLRESSDPLLAPPVSMNLSYEEAIKLAEGKKGKK